MSSAHTLAHLNSDQKKAADAFLEFLMSDEKEFIISGPAGVGKTYLMNYLVNHTLPRYHELCSIVGISPTYKSVVMTATTNKAAEVLAQSIQMQVSTIHSFLGLIVKNDFTNGTTFLSKTRNWQIHENLIIFIDECSMIDRELWTNLQEATMNCKLVYVGDHCQLAPVQESLSPIYRHGIPLVELTKPMRNVGQPALMTICQQLRETVETGVFKPIQIVPGVIDILDGTQMQAQIVKSFAQQNPLARILAYTNKRVIDYNDHVRLLRALPDRISQGELLIANSVIHAQNSTYPIETELTVLKNREVKPMMVDSKHQIEMQVQYLDLQTSLGDYLHRITTIADREHFDALVKHYAKTKQWPLYFALKDGVADLRPRDAATVHKSQGSTYDTVFIDLGNISTCNIPSQVARMLYVAFSRARERVFLYGNLAEKFGGLTI